ncbi:MAG: enoyl-CoA hydratase [Actinobacteria bacterium]|nr:enoyl-CoA hydratase [Actinomycetota bacterium]
MDYQDITLDIADGIATITLNRPDKLNAFTGKMMHEIIDAFDRTDSDDSVKAVIVTGAGKGFCAGADLSSGGDTFAKGGSDIQTKQGVPRDGGGLVSLRIFNSLKPVIGEAKDARLVRSIHSPDDLLPAARELAREIADNTAPVSVALSRRMLWRMLGASHPMDAHRADSRGIQSRGRSNDSKEGVVSFLEKRAAVYPDRVSDGLPDIFPNWEEPEFF